MLFCCFIGGVSASTIYSNGQPDLSDGLEATYAIQASDFTLAASTTFNSISFWAAQGSYNGSIYWAVLDDLTGAPGTNIIASGLISTVAGLATGDLMAGLDVYRYDLDTGNVVLAAGTYWLVLHNGDLSMNSPSDFFWLTAAANGSFSGHEAVVAGSTWGNFNPHGLEHAFELRNTAIPEVPEPAAWLLIAVGLLAVVLVKRRRWAAVLGSTALSLFGAVDPVVHPGTPTFDRPTLTTLGVVLPVTGDENYNAQVNVRYRRTGTSVWKQAQPLFRVRPETVAGVVLTPHFAGSIFHLRPNTGYDVELQVVDPDGGNQTFTLASATRAIPADPATPRLVNVSDAAGLTSALRSAQPGDIIQLANGVYTGAFDINTAGAPGNPIVIRGASQAGTILDGAGCTDCNVLNVYSAGWVHVENLTLRNGLVGLRFQTAGATGHVVRRVRIINTSGAIGARDGQRDFYIADNRFEGPMTWPTTYPIDFSVNGAKSAIALAGDGHVIAHNYFTGWADSIWQWSYGARAFDIYGNQFDSQYDNCVEFDFSAGNTRFYRNNIVNAFMPISVQPVRGGPAYVFRNVVANIVSEPIKFHGSGAEEPSGVLAYHNTFISSQYALQVQTSATSHWFRLLNNLFIGPANPTGGIAVEWNGVIDNGIFNGNGYYPDGYFDYNFLGVGYRRYPTLATAQAGAGVEANGYIAGAGVFASGYVGPADYTVKQNPPSVTLAANSTALDRAPILANINDYYRGAGPDTGALELGCPEPIYGPRPVGTDESNIVYGCESAETSGTATWLRNDTTTRGTWPVSFGSRGWIIAGEGTSASLPATVGAVNGGTLAVWANPSTSLRALRKTPPSLARIAAGWTTSQSMTVDISPKDSNPVQVSAYFLDWGSTPRTQLVEFLDVNGTVLSQQTIGPFQNGVYGVWRITGQVRMRISGAQGSALSGLFFD